MKILVCGDIHWSTYSSILRSRGKNFSTRLEYLIKSLNWVEEMSKKYDCSEEVFLGDTFDKPDLTAEEISALSEIDWSGNCRLRHFIVGNHESGISSLKYNSTQVLHKIGVIEDEPILYPLDDKTDFLFLPYITEDNRKPLSEYLKNKETDKQLVIFSHNDIKDFQMGMFLSKTGFSIDEIKESCDLYINGHLHNGGWVVNNKILNLGVLCGQNFSEDAFKYKHRIAILDTDTLDIEFIENPYSLNFFKLEINKNTDVLQLFSKISKNAVLSIKCINNRKDEVLDLLKTNDKILTYKLVLYEEDISADTEFVSINNIDHLKQFEQFILDMLGSSSVVKEELQEICKQID